MRDKPGFTTGSRLRRRVRARPSHGHVGAGGVDDLDGDEGRIGAADGQFPRVEPHGGRPVQLSPTEFKLLRYLLINRERVLSKSQILDHVWQYDFDGNASVVENYISYLRKKIDDIEPRLIRTVRGFGYVLRSEP